MADSSTKQESATKKQTGKAKTEKKARTEGRGLAKEREGVVVSDKMTKTVVVATTRMVKHAMYGKYVKRTVKYYAHDEKETCSVGDRVRIVEVPPMSRLKRWKVREIITKAE